MPKKTRAEVQLTTVRKLTSQWLLSASVEEMSDDEAAAAWSFLDLMEAISKDRKTQIRAKLLDRIEEVGDENEKGSFVANMEGAEVIKEKRQAKLPDPNLVEELLKEREMNISEAFDQETKWVMSPSKIDFLVQGGKLPGDQLEASKKVTWALKVKPNPQVKGFIAETKKALGPKK